MATAQTEKASVFSPKQTTSKDLVQIKEGQYIIMVQKSDLLGKYSDKSWSDELTTLLQTKKSFTTEELDTQLRAWSTTEDRFSGLKPALADFIEHNEVLIFHGTSQVKTVTKNPVYEGKCRVTNYLDDKGQNITSVSICVE